MPLTYVPDVIDHPSPNHSARVLYRGQRVDTVLLHHTGGPPGAKGDASNRAWLCSLQSGVSAHYLVETTGRILRLVPERLKAWHAGIAHLPWEKGPWLVKGKPNLDGYDFNHRSIGIEIVNPGDGRTPFTEAQYTALAWLVPDILSRMSCSSVRLRMEEPIRRVPHNPPHFPAFVLGHRDVAPTRKTDPADNFDWQRVRDAFAGGLV